jgi:NADPH-dependent 2,4-dienoyl-CoA reductase/sulfur reductase-like enzyme/rhodanese-related sulfurtransferase
MPRRIVVLGGGLAGFAAARRAREIDEDAAIVLVDPPDYPAPVPGLAYALSGEAVAEEVAARRRAESLRDHHRVEVRGGRVDRIDAGARAVVVDGKAVEYSALVFALPAQPKRMPALEPAGNATHLRTPGELQVLRAALGGRAGRVAVLGAGPTAIEAADALRRGGHEVSVLTRQPRLLPDFTAEGSRRVSEALAAFGATVRPAADVTATEKDGERVRALVLADGSRYEVDAVVLAGPLEPATALLRAAGAELHDDGTVSIDEYCATSLAHVYACGLSVSVPHAVSLWPVWSPHPVLADRTAQVAGACAAGAWQKLVPVVNSVVVRAGDLVAARTGLSRAEAVAFAAEEAGTVTIHGSTTDRFLAASRAITLELVFHRGNGRILGAEAAGGAGVDKRIDVMAAAIAGQLSVERLASLELAYAPTFGTIRDPVNTAGTVAAAWRAGLSRVWEAHELFEARDAVTLVDVEPQRGALGDEMDARAIPLAELREKLTGLPKGRPLVFLSQTGRLGYLASRIARQMGFRDAGFLTGGLLSWRAAGLPLERQGASR